MTHADQTPPSLADEPEAQPVAPIRGPNAAPRRELVLELLVVFLIGVFPHIVNGAFWLFFLGHEMGGEPVSDGFAAQSVAHIVGCIAIIAAVLWIMHKAPEPWSAFGFLRVRRVVDVLIGLGLYIGSYIAYIFVSWGLYAVAEFFGWWWLVDWGSHAGGFESGAIATPSGALVWPLILGVAFFNATAEQLVITGYGLSRLTTLIERRGVVLAIAVTCFASYHAYQGPYGLVNAVIFGIIFGTYFLRSRRLYPCLVAHFLGDLVPYMLASTYA